MLHESTRKDERQVASQPGLPRFFAQITEFVLRHGAGALDAMERLHRGSPDSPPGLGQLLDLGLLKLVCGHYRLTPRAVALMERRALNEALAGLGGPDSHADADEPDLAATVSKALHRQGAACPMAGQGRDLAEYLSRYRSPAAVAMLVHVGGSMGRFSRLVQAKKAAMAMFALADKSRPGGSAGGDSLDVIAFDTTARIVPRAAVPLLTPSPGGEGNEDVNLRLPLKGDAPGGFVNLQSALRLGGEVLARRPPANKLVFVVTDRAPTAHVEGDELVLLRPPSRRAAAAALAEAVRLARAGIEAVTFALIDDDSELDWVDFADELTRVSRGAGFYCGADQLGGCMLESYLAGKQPKARTA